MKSNNSVLSRLFGGVSIFIILAVLLVGMTFAVEEGYNYSVSFNHSNMEANHTDFNSTLSREEQFKRAFTRHLIKHNSNASINNTQGVKEFMKTFKEHINSNSTSNETKHMMEVLKGSFKIKNSSGLNQSSINYIKRNGSVEMTKEEFIKVFNKIKNKTSFNKTQLDNLTEFEKLRLIREVVKAYDKNKSLNKNVSFSKFLNGSEIMKIVKERVNSTNKFQYENGSFNQKKFAEKNFSKFKKSLILGNANISVNNKSNGLEVTLQNKKVSISLNKGKIFVNNKNKLFIKDQNQTFDINLTPDKIMNNLQNVSITNLSLTLNNKTPIYKVKLKEKGKIFWLFDTEIDSEYDINALNGSVIKKSQKPWYVFDLPELKSVFK